MDEMFNHLFVTTFVITLLRYHDITTLAQSYLELLQCDGEQEDGHA